MSSSKGNVISVAEMLEVAPPEVLKYAITKVKPNRRIVFDPGLALLQLIDEFDDTTSPHRHARAAELSAVTGSPPLGVPFRHLVSLVQIAGDDVELIVRILNRTGYPVVNTRGLRERLAYAGKWLEKFAPEEVRFEVQQELPTGVSSLSELQRKALGLLAARIEAEAAEEPEKGLTGEEIHSLIYKVKDELGIDPKDVFAAIYQSILGKEHGPRAGFFLGSLPMDFVLRRFREAAGQPVRG